MSFLSKIISVFNGTDSTPEKQVLGVDVAHWQGSINWATMYSKGVRWAITKATDIGYNGKGFVDDNAVANYQGMIEQGILSGAYCWLDPRSDPYYQANFYLNHMQKLQLS